MYFVYRFVDKSKSVIYVGKSKQNLQQRFAGHLHLPEDCYRMVKKIEYIECPTEADMSIKEIYYINKYKDNPICFNVLDVTETPTSIDFIDKWKTYRGALPEQFSNSINFKKGYTQEKEVRYNKDGTIDKRKGKNKQKGVESYVEALTSDETNRIAEYMITQINESENGNQEQIRFRNLVMFVLGVNLPIKTNEFLTLKYSDLFDENDKVKNYSLELGRFNKDEIISIPLRKIAKNTLCAYTRKYGLTYANNGSDYLFQSRIGDKPVSLNAWWRILTDAATNVNITKNIGAESIRKTYGYNVFHVAEDQLNALLFLSELWGRARETQVIKYLNLTETDVNFEHYLGETYSLCDMDLAKIRCLRTTAYYTYAPNTLSSKQRTADHGKEYSQKKERKKKWTKDEKLEVVSRYDQLGTFQAVGKVYNMDPMIVSRWVKAYREYGEAAFDEE